MAEQSFSREYLQGLPEKLKRTTINKMIDGFAQSVKQTATAGKTSYIYDMTQPNHEIILRYYFYQINDYQFAPQVMAPNNMHDVSESIIPMNDIVSQIQERFPDCKVSYQETWINVSSNTRKAKKGILIDWS